MSAGRLAVAALLLWAAAFATYSNSFTIAFQFDDLHTVQSNAYIRSLSYIPRFFVDATTYSYRPETSGYRPMASLACALAFQLSHIETWGFHLVKLLEHCLVAFLVMLVSLRLLPRKGLVAETPGGRELVAFFGALVFAVHRANTETVDYITAISSLQAGLFDLLAFYLYLRFREAPGKRVRLALACAAVVCYEAAMMSKEEGITLPAVLLLYEWIYGRKSAETYRECLRANWKRWAKLLAPYTVAALVYLVLRTTIQPAVADSSRGNIPRFVYFITQLRAWLHYWALFFWPVELNSDNLAFDFSQGLDDYRVWLALALNSAIWIAAWRAGRRRRFVHFAVAWAYVTVLPASSIFPLVEAVNEHRMYIPYMMIAPLTVWLFFSAVLRATRAVQASPAFGRAAAASGVAMIALLLGVGAYARNTVWQTELSLWEDVYSKNKDSPRALNVLGISLLNAKKYQRGLPMLERCHQMAPTYLPCMVHLSIGYAHEHRYDEGLKVLLFGHSLNPDYPHLNFHLGLYYKDYLGRPDEAIPYFSRVLELTQGRFYEATIKLAELQLDKGAYDQALKIAGSVLELDRSNGSAWAVVGRAHLMKGDQRLAGMVFHRLVEAAPEVTRFYLDLANWQERNGDLKGALETFRKATSRDEELIQGFQGIARVAHQLGDRMVERQGEFAVSALKAGGHWLYYPSLALKGETPGQTKP